MKARLYICKPWVTTQDIHWSFCNVAQGFQHITACYVYESPIKPSVIISIFLRLQWDFNFTQCSYRHHATGNISLHRVAAEHIEQYKDVLNGEQTELTDSVLYCIDELHRADISNLCNQLINNCLEAGDQCFPKWGLDAKQKQGGILRSRTSGCANLRYAVHSRQIPPRGKMLEAKCFPTGENQTRGVHEHKQNPWFVDRT